MLQETPKIAWCLLFISTKMSKFLDDPGTFDEFVDKFLAGQVIWGKWTDHVKSWRNTDLGDRILYITYEELIQDLRGVLKRILHFLGREMSEESLDHVTHHCLFKSMKQNKMSNYSLISEKLMDRNNSVLRKGISGDWKNHFSPELEAKFNTVIRKEMEGSGITFAWDEE